MAFAPCHVLNHFFALANYSLREANVEVPCWGLVTPSQTRRTRAAIMKLLFELGKATTVNRLKRRAIWLIFTFHNLNPNIKKVHTVKDLGVSVASKFKCNESVENAHRMMGLIEIFSFFNNKYVPPLYESFVRPYLRLAMQFRSSY